MASSELRKRKLEEYEMQLFNFHSRAVYATLKNIVSQRIYYAIQKLCDTIKMTYKPNSENLAILKANQKQLERAYCKAALPHLGNIENIVNKYIAVPSNVLLEEDKYQRTQYNESEFESMKNRLEDLQQRAKRATMLNTVFKEELQILEQFAIPEAGINDMCSVIENCSNCPDVNDKLNQLMEDHTVVVQRLLRATPMAEKTMYNSMDNLKCRDLDLCTL